MSGYRYDAMIGVGGIGTGSFFLLNGNATLGREESRGGRFLDRRDYCKLHIISHYVKALLGSEFEVVPVGKVGRDDAGKRLVGEMTDAGLEMRHVTESPDKPTLFSFCFIYPDGSGGNMTTDDSACSEVTSEYVATAESVFEQYRDRGIALAVPEVPLEARETVLDLGTEYGFLRVASFTSEEIVSGATAGMLDRIDLLALNVDEAAAIAGCATQAPHNVAQLCVEKLCKTGHKMLVSITAGASGSWTSNGSEMHHLPVYPVEVASTAGAGDAHLSGMIAGLTAGLGLADAHQLGALVASMSVTSPHTINKEVTRASLRPFADGIGAELAPAVGAFLG